MRPRALTAALALGVGLLLSAGCDPDPSSRPDGGVDARTADASAVDATPAGDAEPPDAGPSPDAALGDLIWAFSAGDLDPVDYQALVDTFPLGSENRPQPDSNSYRLPLPIPPQMYGFLIGHEVPLLLPDGRIRTYMPEVAQNQHMMFKMYNPDVLLDGSHFRMRQAYKIELEADFSAASDWASVPWCIFLQVWGSSYPGSWQTGNHPRNPPFALSLDSAEFEVRVYGEHVTDLDSVADNLGWTHADSANWAFTPGPHLFEVWFTADYREPAAGGIGYVRVDMDGQTVYERTDIVNAILRQVAGEDAGGIIMYGAYTYSALPEPSYADVVFDDIRVYAL